MAETRIIDGVEYEVVPIPPANGSKRTTLGRLYDTDNYDIDKQVRLGTGVVKPDDQCQTEGCTTAWNVVHATDGWKLCGVCAAIKRQGVLNG